MRQELYEECGITVKTLGRTISKLKEDGVISLKKENRHDAGAVSSGAEYDSSLC